MTLALASMLVSALLVGLLIGCVGIGGVLLPPALVYVGGLEFHLAAATSAWAFLFCGVAGTLSYSKRRSFDWWMAGWLGAGVVPTAIAGAWANVALPEGALIGLLAALMVATGVEALLRSPVVEQEARRRFGAPTLLAVGAFVGFGSALTGTGGGVLLLPILLLLRTPVLATVGAGMVVSLPIAVFATAGYVLYGSVDFVLGTALGLVAVVGVVVGARIAHVAKAAARSRVGPSLYRASDRGTDGVVVAGYEIRIGAMRVFGNCVNRKPRWPRRHPLDNLVNRCNPASLTLPRTEAG